MANTFITPTQVARRAVATLYDQTVMLPLVSRDFESEFVPGVGASVNYRKPATFTANTFSQAVGVTKQDVTETYGTITLDQHKEVTVEITSADRTLHIRDFQEQIIAPAMEALSQAVDAALLALRDDVTTNSVTMTAYDESTNLHPSFDLIEAGRLLTGSKVPKPGRVTVVDQNIAAQLNRDNLMNRSDARGQSGLTSAMQANDLGRAFGFENYETNAIDNYEGIAFHPSAFQFVSRPLALPQGASRSEVVSYKGVSVRVTYGYDPTYLSDILTFDILFGTKTVDETRACILNGLAASV